jgi:hypothetical protein
VIALGRGGVLESVPRDPLGGVFYAEPNEAELAAALARFEEMEPVIEPKALQRHAAGFSEAEFCAKMAHVLGLPGVPSGQHLGQRA